MPYSVPPLPYDYAALEPHIDEQTMRIHHDKHHQAYVDNASTPRSRAPSGPTSRSRTSSATSRRFRRTSAASCATTAAGTSTTRSSGNFMSPTGGGAPSGDLAAAIDAKFGSFDAFKATSRPPASTSSARAGPGSSRTPRASRSSRPPTRTTPSRTAWRRCSASTSGSTPTTSTTRTAARTTSTPGGTSSNWAGVAQRFARLTARS